MREQKSQNVVNSDNDIFTNTHFLSTNVFLYLLKRHKFRISTNELIKSRSYGYTRQSWQNCCQCRKRILQTLNWGCCRLCVGPWCTWHTGHHWAPNRSGLGKLSSGSLPLYSFLFVCFLLSALALGRLKTEHRSTTWKLLNLCTVEQVTLHFNLDFSPGQMKMTPTLSPSTGFKHSKHKLPVCCLNSPGIKFIL